MPLADNPNLPLFTAKSATISIENLPQLTAISITITKGLKPDGTSKINVTAILDVPFPDSWKALEGQKIPKITIIGEGKTRTLLNADFFHDPAGTNLYFEAASVE